MERKYFIQKPKEMGMEDSYYEFILITPTATIFFDKVTREGQHGCYQLYTGEKQSVLIQSWRVPKYLIKELDKLLSNSETMNQTPEEWVRKTLAEIIENNHIVLFKKERETEEGVIIREAPRVTIGNFINLFGECIREGKTSADELIEYSKKNRLGYEEVFKAWKGKYLS